MIDIEVPSNRTVSTSGIDLPDIEFGKIQEDPVATSEEDLKEVAVKFGIIGSGQAGNRLADMFYQVGYRRVCAVNTTDQDFLGLIIPENKRLILKGDHGAGKDPSKGQEALKKSSEQVLNLMRHTFGEDVEWILVCAGAGGGCISPDANILTSDGLMKAGEVFSQYAGGAVAEGENGSIGYDLSEEIKVASWDLGRQEVSWNPIERIWDVPEKNALTINNRLGALTCSEDHIVFTYNPSSDSLVEKKASDLTINDVLFRSPLGGFGQDYDKSLMWLLGYFAGNGNFKWTYEKLHCVRFDDEDKSNLEKVSSIAMSLGATSTNLQACKGQNSYCLYTYGSDFISCLIDTYGALRPIKGNLRFPTIARTCNTESFIAFLAGVHSADGHIRKGRPRSIDLAMIDLPFINDLYEACSAHGLTATYRVKTSVRSNERPLGRLTIFNWSDPLSAMFREHLVDSLKTEWDAGDRKPIKTTDSFPLKYSQIKHLFTESPQSCDYTRDSYSIANSKFEASYGDKLNKDSLLSKIYQRLVKIDSIASKKPMKFIDFTVKGNANYFAGNGSLTLVHNSGSGSVFGLVTLAKYYMRLLGKEEKVGVITTLPKKTEGGKVQANAYHTIKALQPQIDDKSISPFVLVDNESINQMFPNASAKAFWTTANRNIVGLFDIFNVLACQQSAYVTFDRADYKTMLDSGTIIYGATSLDNYSKDTDISDGLRVNLERTLLADLDLANATHVAAILCAPDGILGVLPQSHIDLAFTTLERIIGGENRDLTVHQGVYETKKVGLFLYTMVGGLKIPEKRLEIMKARAGF